MTMKIRKYSKEIMLLLSFLIVVAFCIYQCHSENVVKAKYSIDHYIDTVAGNVILTTVCEGEYNLSSSTLILKQNDK